MNGRQLYMLHEMSRKAQGWTTDAWISLSPKERRTWDNTAAIITAWKVNASVMVANPPVDVGTKPDEAQT